eukprot:1157375-Pelagomonas_calceolata.AAC.14
MAKEESVTGDPQPRKDSTAASWRVQPLREPPTMKEHWCKGCNARQNNRNKVQPPYAAQNICLSIL